MAYYVSMAVDGRVSIKVDDATSPEDAREKAEELFLCVELGELEVVGHHPVNAEDDDGHLTDF